MPTHYYLLQGYLIGSTNTSSTTTYDLTDGLGSVLTSFSGSAIQGEQLYGPYGNQCYLEGSLGTDKGYTGQVHDAVTGLDYSNARYYDPVVGQFLSPDSVQGNAQGMDPYAYVGGNPETRTDPTGQAFCESNGSGGCATAGGSVDISVVPLLANGGVSAAPGSINLSVAPLRPKTAPPCPSNTSCSGKKNSKASYLQNLGFTEHPDGGGDGGNTLAGVGLGGLEYIISVLRGLLNDLLVDALAGMLKPDFFATVANTGLGVVGIPGIADFALPAIIAAGVASTIATLAPVVSANGDISMQTMQNAFNLLLTPLQSLESTVTADLAEHIGSQTVTAVEHTVFVLNEVDTYNDVYQWVPEPGGPVLWDTGIPDYSSLAGAAWTVDHYSLG